MRVFSKNAVLAKSKFWKQMSLLNKIKRANGQVLSVNEVKLLISDIRKEPQLREDLRNRPQVPVQKLHSQHLQGIQRRDFERRRQSTPHGNVWKPQN